MLIEKQSHELLASIIRWNPCCTFLVDTAGRFVAINKSFAEWSGFAAYEIEGQSLNRVLVSDENLKNSFTDQIAGLNDRDPTTQVRTQMRPNGGKPVWGTLHTNRYSDKETVIYWCVWEPLRDDTQAAFALALERTQEHALVMNQLRAEIRSITQRDQDEDWIVNTIRMMRKYPKTVFTIVTFIIASFFPQGFNGWLEMGQRFGIIPSPTPSKPQTGFLEDPLEQYQQYAGQNILAQKVYSFQLDSGRLIQWEYGNGLRSGRCGSEHSGWYGISERSRDGERHRSVQFPCSGTADGCDGGSGLSRAEPKDEFRI